MASRNCCKCVTVSLVPAASLILVILFASGIVLLPILYVELSHNYKYGIIIDAGSSHTTLYGYRWRVPITTSTGVIDVQEIYTCPHGGSMPSLNSFANNPSKAAKAFEHCLDQIETYRRSLPIPEEKHYTTPLYLGATAGMRVLNMTDPSISDAIFKTVRKALRNSDYQFKDARIITGEEEAIGGWTTTNFLEKNLNPPKDRTVGALDLGGASAEISFEVFDSSSPSVYNSSEKLFDKTHNIFARSFLCYGDNEAYRRFLAYLATNKTDLTNVQNNVPNPCLYKNEIVSYHHDDIFVGCANSSAAVEAFGYGYAPPTSLGADVNITFVGTGNFTECELEISNVFDFSKCRPKSNCKPNTTFTPPQVNGNFIGFSAFYWISDYFNQSKVNFSRTGAWNNFRDVVKTNCSQGTNDTCMVDGKVKKGCSRWCFKGLFMLFLLEHGFGFSNTAANDWSVQFEQNVNGISVGWALGYMLNQTSSIPQNSFVEQRPYSAVDLVVGILILTILCAVFVVFFFLTFYACRRALRSRHGFQPL